MTEDHVLPTMPPPPPSKVKSKSRRITVKSDVAEQKQVPEELTIAMFKMWLQGVEEMQRDGWTPNAAQWKTIRDKIDSIVDTPAQQTSVYRGGDHYVPPVGYYQTPNIPHMPTPPAGYELNPLQVAQTFIDSGGPTDAGAIQMDTKGGGESVPANQFKMLGNM